MRKFEVWRIAMVLHHINASLEVIKPLTSDPGTRDAVMDSESVKCWLDGNILSASLLAKELNLQSTFDRVWENGHFTMLAKVGLTWQEAEHELTVLRQCIESDLEKRTFVFIPPDKAEFLNPGSAVGEWGEIINAIEPCKTDIREAIYCYALERNTAAVFHLMRVAEYGLRHLAKKLRVRLTHSGHSQPIEFADWNKVITGIKNKLAKVSQLPVGPKRQEKLEIYSDAADHCTYMKDIWRNNISHSRKPYKAPEALAVMERIRDFMKFLVGNFK